MFSYVVRCAFENRDAMTKFVAWLRDDHIAKVLAAGARSAAIVELDTQTAPHVIEVRYELASRADFETYEREHAPRLREEGIAFMKSIGLEPGRDVVLTRTTGELVLTFQNQDA